MNQQVCASYKTGKPNCNQKYILCNCIIFCFEKLLKLFVFQFDGIRFFQGDAIYVISIRENTSEQYTPFQSAKSAIPSHEVQKHRDANHDWHLAVDEVHINAQGLNNGG